MSMALFKPYFGCLGCHYQQRRQVLTETALIESDESCAYVRMEEEKMEITSLFSRQ